jgi:hypothetical protein
VCGLNYFAQEEKNIFGKKLLHPFDHANLSKNCWVFCCRFFQEIFVFDKKIRIKMAFLFYDGQTTQLLEKSFVLNGMLRSTK